MAEIDVNYAWLEVVIDSDTSYYFATRPEMYVERDITDFAPRAGGGDVQFSNLDLYQIVTQADWHHGLGFVEFRDKSGYRVGTGVDTRAPSMAFLYTDPATDYAAANQVMSMYNGVDFLGSTYFNCGSNGIWKRTTVGTWSKVLAANVNDLMSNGSYLIAAIASGQMQTSADGTSWSNAGVSGNPPSNFTHLAIQGGFMWGSESSTTTRTLTGTYNGPTLSLSSGISVPILGVDSSFLSELVVGAIVKVGSTVIGYVTAVYSDTAVWVRITTGGTVTTGDTIISTRIVYYPVVHYWSAGDSSDAEGGGIKDVFSVVIGPGNYTIRNMASFNGSLYVARDDGVWVIDQTNTTPIAIQVLNFKDEQDSSNFTIFVPWNGRLYFNVKNTLYSYTGSSLAAVTPPTYDFGFPPTGYGGYVAAAYRGPFFYLICKTNEATPNYVMLAFDGTGWHQLLILGTDSYTGMMYSPLTNILFLNKRASENDTVYKIQLQSLTELPYASFPTTGDHFLYMSEIDYGLRRVKKSIAEIDLEVYNHGSGRYVEVAYAVDGGSYTVLGQTSVDGVNQLAFNPTVQYNKLDVRLNFKTATANQSPVLRNVTIKSMVRPDTLYGRQVTLYGADDATMLDGRKIPYTSVQQRAQLIACRNSKAPLTIISPFGETIVGYFSTLQFRNLERRPGEEHSNWDATVNIVQTR